MEQKKFDYNSFIGMILLGGILLWWMNTNKPEDLSRTSTKVETVKVTRIIIQLQIPVFQRRLFKATCSSK